MMVRLLTAKKTIAKLHCYGGLTPPQGYAQLTKCIFRQYTDIRRVGLLRLNRPRRDPPAPWP
eukprot:6212904-Pleurochrysis_carterae.AAC.1